jgi:oligoendopeptidase F
MQNSSIQKARALSPELRRAVENLLGRKLQEDERVQVSVPQAETLSENTDQERRKRAVRRLRDFGQKHRLSLDGVTIKQLLHEGHRY